MALIVLVMDDEGNRTMFLGQPPSSEAADAIYADDRTSNGYVDNLTRLWCWRPDMLTSFAALRAGLMERSSLTDRDRAVLVTATASERGDSYCSLAWGTRLAELSDDRTAARVIVGVAAP